VFGVKGVVKAEPSLPVAVVAVPRHTGTEVVATGAVVGAKLAVLVLPVQAAELFGVPPPGAVLNTR
jgi:hypothetical protein